MNTFTQSEDINQTIRNEQTRLLYAITPYSAAYTILMSLILSYLQWDFVEHSYVIFWSLGMIAVSLIRVGGCLIYKKSKSPNRPYWLYSFVATTYCAGIMWGAAAIWLFPAGSIVGQTILAFLIGGSAAVAVTSLSYMRITGLGFLSLMLLPLCIQFFIDSQHAYSNVMSFSILFFYIIMTSTSLRIYNNTKQNISLSYQSFLDSLEISASKEEAEKANQAKSTFLSSMSHELRTPLSAIIGYAEILKYEAGPLNEEQIESADYILSAGKHLLGLINEVLDLAKVESEDTEMSLSAIDPVPELEQCMAIAKAMSKKYGVTVQEKESDQNLPEVIADPARLKQIMINLLSNAIKYNHRGGSVTLACENNESDRLRIKVTDTGPGIAKNKQKELFIPFNRLGVENTNIEGTGIGLAITQKLAERMGADLNFESQEGKGSSFWVDVPIVNKTA